MRYPVLNLGQYDIAEERHLLREACSQADFYQSMAQQDPSYQDTADWYSSLCAERQAALTSDIQQIAQQETPLAMEGSNLGWRRRVSLVAGLGTRVLGR